MADDIDTQLAALEAKAPETAEMGDEGFTHNPLPAEPSAPSAPVVGDPAAAAAPATGAEPQAGAQTTDTSQTPAGADEDKALIAKLQETLTNQRGLAQSERAKRRAEAAEKEQLKAQVVAFQQQMAMIEQRIRMAQNPAPDPETNIVEAVQYERHQRMLQQQQQAAQQQAYLQQAQQAQYVNNLRATVDDFETEFKEEHPDYDEAADYLVDLEQRRLMAMGVPEPQASQASVAWAVNMADMMVRQGRNPAQAAYEAAKLSGWAGKKPPAAAAAPAPAQPGAAPTLPTVGDPQADAIIAQANAILAQRRAGQLAATTLSGGGTANGNDGSLKAIVGLKGAAFDSAVEKFLSS